MNEPLTAFLTADHEDIDLLLARAIEGDVASLAAFKSQLRLHMRVEEEILFPAIEGTPLALPARAMIRDHALLRELVDDDDLQALPTCLGSHNVKEERIVYSACERPEFASVLARVRKALPRFASVQSNGRRLP
ncbi:MAG: hemerythrin domain-containing protein [Myxococcales bacterium]